MKKYAREIILALVLLFATLAATFSQAVVFESTSLEINEEVIEKATSIVLYEKSCLFLQENHAENYKFNGEWSKGDYDGFKIQSIMVTKDGVDYMIAICYVYEADIWFINLYRPEGEIYFYGKFQDGKPQERKEEIKGSSI